MTDLETTTASSAPDERPWPPRWRSPSNRVFAFGCAVAVASLLFSVADAWTVASVIAGLILFTLPGYALLSALVGPRLRGSPEHVIWASVLGHTVSSLLALVVGYLGGWKLLPIAATLILTSLATYLASVRRTAHLRSLTVVSWGKGDYSLWLCFSALAILAVFLPFTGVGSLTPKGIAFPSLFGFDFILRLSFSAALSHGVPPGYLNYSGLHLQTYWLFYVFPGFVHMATGYRLPLQSIFIVTQVFQILVFLGGLFSLLRLFVRNKTALGLTLFLIVCAYSYYGYFAVLKSALAQMTAGQSGLLRSTGALEQLSLLSHSYFRDFVVEPQALCAMALILLGLRLVAFDSDNLADTGLSAVVGFLAGCAFGVDASIGLIFIGWYGSLFILDLKRWRQDLMAGAVFCGVVAGAAFVFALVGMYSYGDGTSGMQVKPYFQIMLVAPGYFLLDYGPMVVFAGWYIIAERKRGMRRELLPVLALGLCSLAFIFFVRHNFETNVGLRKGMKTLQIPLLILSGLFFEAVYLQARARPIVRNVVRALVLVAVPTLWVDIYSASTVTNEGNTSFVDAADYEACAWLKRHTPIDAVIQSEPEYPSVYQCTP